MHLYTYIIYILYVNIHTSYIFHSLPLPPAQLSERTIYFSRKTVQAMPCCSALQRVGACCSVLHLSARALHFARNKTSCKCHKAPPTVCQAPLHHIRWCHHHPFLHFLEIVFHISLAEHDVSSRSSSFFPSFF